MRRVRGGGLVEACCGEGCLRRGGGGWVGGGRVEGPSCEERAVDGGGFVGRDAQIALGWKGPSKVVLSSRDLSARKRSHWVPACRSLPSIFQQSREPLRWYQMQWRGSGCSVEGGRGLLLLNKSVLPICFLVIILKSCLLIL